MRTNIWFNQIIDRLPLSVESLKTSKLGKIVVKLVKDPPTPGEYLFMKNLIFVCARRDEAVFFIFVILQDSLSDNMRKCIIDVSNFVIFVLLVNCSCQGYGIQRRTKMASDLRGRLKAN